jgi:hypothetical protein
MEGREQFRDVLEMAEGFLRVNPASSLFCLEYMNPTLAGMLYAALGHHLELISGGLETAALQLQLETMFPQLEVLVWDDKVVFIIDPISKSYWHTVEHLFPADAAENWWAEFYFDPDGRVGYEKPLTKEEVGAYLWKTSGTC